MSSAGKNIVTIGGGGGHSAVVASLFQDVPQLTAICNTADCGGSSGILRKEGVHPPGDVRQIFCAVTDEATSKELAFRYVDGPKKGHTNGNLLLAELEKETGSFQAAIDVLRERYNIKTYIVPLTNMPGELQATMTSGDTITSQAALVDRVWEDPSDSVVNLSLLPEHIALSDRARHALQAADVIIVPMGDIYSSVGPAFCVPELQSLWRELSATVVWLPNSVAPMGHKHYHSVESALRFFQELTPGFSPDYIVCHDGQFSDKEKETLSGAGYRLVDQVTEGLEATVIKKDFVNHDFILGIQPGDPIRRSPIRYKQELLRSTLLDCINTSL